MDDGTLQLRGDKKPSGRRPSAARVQRRPCGTPTVLKVHRAAGDCRDRAAVGLTKRGGWMTVLAACTLNAI